MAAIVIASGYSTVAAVKSALVLSVGQRRFSHGSKTGSDGVAMGAGVSQIKSQLNTNSYARYSFGCAPVWGCHPRCRAAAAGFANLAEPAVGCGGWWSGWASATIARVGFPPPRKLMPEGERRVAIVSLALVGVGLISVVRLLVTGNRPARN
ncbi:MAG: hypothetical protein ACJ780_22360 [Solirubrobacteraceae bacterium]